MSKSTMKLSAAALAITFALSAGMPVQAQDAPTADTVVATVNGVEITLGHMLVTRAGLPEQYNELPSTVLWEGVMDQLIQQSVLAHSDGTTESKGIKLALENQRRAMLASEAITKIAEDSIDEAAIKAAYEANYARANMGTEFDASHILVETEEEAQAIEEELKAGGDFAVLAKEKSTGPSGPNGGALGWFGAGMMVEPFQKAVEALKPGEVSAPVQTQFGWHVIKLNDARTKSAPPLEEVRDQIVEQLQKAAVEDAISGLLAKADITRTAPEAIDTAVIDDLELVGN
ncbi:peptidylprolyl isomerase [Puniceibacterium sediminis]|uniref:Parvulin-like PPIase n=1 Tax=Puniceibacterium sediminis TaxID=1608407 RepID=A0A238VWH5_9RHOB|nr:peptidylprolyl isomerase [Puniceibacterium sediminis]SNR38675.1 peptidyl-prolyl cis-trans isomerase C [Puniceibacterium sediminis]